MKENEEAACDVADGIREDIRDSKHGKLKLLVFDTLPLTVGAACGGIARATGFPQFIAVLPVMNLMTGFGPSHSNRAIARNMLGYAAYAIGSALPDVDKIYEAAQNFLE